MSSEASKSLSGFGFLTAIDDPQYGYFGGYLVLSALGRPLEFHCSTPVLPSPAQRILYGASLKPYVLGELIGHTLLSKSQIPVQAVLTDLPEMLSLSLLASEPVACVVPEVPDRADTIEDVPALAMGEVCLIGATHADWQPEGLRTLLEPLLINMELREPFERIRGAIEEARRITQQSAEGIHEAAAA